MPKVMVGGVMVKRTTKEALFYNQEIKRKQYIRTKYGIEEIKSEK